MIRISNMLLACYLMSSSAAAQDCVEINHTFASGANWRICADVNNEHGLSLTDMHYFAPGDSSRQVLQALHLAQILMMHHDRSDVDLLLGQSSQHSLVPLNSKTCDGTLHIQSDTQTLCSIIRPLPVLAKYGTRRALQGGAIDVFAVSAHESLIWRSNVRLTEDGRIIPSVSMSGLRRNSKTSTDGSATLQTSWRMAFALNGDGTDDRVEQLDFPLNRNAGNRRAMQIKPITTESFALVARDDFRGWRVLDETGSGYYLDPQNSGYQMASSTFNWAKFDLAITAFKNCEQLAADNQAASCEGTLDAYLSGETLSGRAPVLWYSQSRIYRPRTEDNPVITSLHTNFELLPFDWTSSSPFEALD
ncbi:MAG: hypothetical protein V3U65_17185 [Granulosicoccaceae bacterium]